MLGTLLSLPAMAYSFDYVYQGQRLIYEVIDETAKTCKVASNQPPVTGDLVIPSVVTDAEAIYRVISIDHLAFARCSALTSVTIPGSVTSIGEWAFAECYGLERAEFASIEALCKIDFGSDASNPLQYAGHLYIDGKEVTDIVIPESFTSIGNYTFCGAGITSVTIPSTVTSIGDGAFEGCYELTSVTIPEGVTTIGDVAFFFCTALRSVTIPGSVTSIGSNAFNRCALTSVIIPEGVTSIGYGAFYDCVYLHTVTIPGSITSIGDEAFGGFCYLTTIYYAADKPISGNYNIFDSRAYSFATLYMTKNGVALSTEIDPWKNFVDVKEYVPTGVDDVIADTDEAAPCEIYNLNGVKVGNGVESLAPGLYIRRNGNTTDKVIVK